MTDYGKLIADRALDISAIKLNPEEPFQWASGYMMPIYNDNRKFLFYPDDRKLIADGFMEDITRNNIECDIIAGTSTAGIAPATILAERLRLPLVYVRGEAKGHGMKNIIEGIGESGDLLEKNVLIIEDLISTGGSSTNVVQTLRDEGANANNCLSIFNYGFKEAIKKFSDMYPPCKVNSLLCYDALLERAVERKYISEEQFEILNEWRESPFMWGERHGFPRKVA